MGQVYRAFDPTLKREVALKFLSGDDPIRLARFVREAQAQARVDHPNVCRVWEVGEVDGLPYIAMQLIAGEPLNRMAPRLAVEQTVVIARQVAEALHAAHRIGLIHRDIKPANIMVEVSADGAYHPYVVDFGLARDTAQEGLTIADSVVGTPSFMSPEQASGDLARVDRRTDVYSLGATLYEALAGRPPLVAQTPLAVMRMVVDTDPPPLRSVAPAVPPDLEAVVMKCLEKEPERRYESARALAEDLGRFLDGEPVKAWRAGRLYRTRKFARRHRRLLAAASVAAVAVFVLFGLWISARRSVSRTAALAQRFGQRVEQVEGMLWRARSLPLHDIRPSKRLARQRLEEIAKETKSLGALAYGPGESALGRGYLALNELDAAHEHLQAAWDSGYRPPEVAYALGLALGRLYERELSQIAGIRDRNEREERRKSAQAQFRDPAVTALRASRGVDVAHPAYLKALLESYEEKEEDALRHAEEAFAAVPWLHEAKVLGGEVLTRRAVRLHGTGQYGEAAIALARAESAYAAAADIARSDERALAGRCSCLATGIYLDAWYQGRCELAAVERATEVCRRAILGDPDGPGPYLDLAVVKRGWAQVARQSGHDATAELEEAIDAAKTAARLRPGSTEPAKAVTQGYWMLGQAAFEHERDPSAPFEEGARFARAFLERYPASSAVAGSLGLLLLDRGDWQISRKVDPRSSLSESVGWFARASELAPADARHPVNMAIAYATLLGWEVDAGLGDPAATAARSIEAARRALAIHPGLFWALRTEGQVHVHMARLDARKGADPGREVAAALASLEKALEVNANDATTLELLAGAWVTQVEWDRARGRAAAAAIAKAREAVRRGLALNPTSTELKKSARQLDEIAGR